MQPIIEVTLTVTNVLTDLDVPYLAVGSLASSIHGLPRYTRDIDFVVDLRAEYVQNFVELLEPKFFVQEESIRQAIRDQSSFNIIHLETMFKVDIFVAKSDLASRNQLERREEKPLSQEPKQAVVVASAEDTILQKLRWYKLGNEVSDQQWSDVQGVMKVQSGDLDLAYLKEMTDHMRITELLKRALSDAGLAE